MGEYIFTPFLHNFLKAFSSISPQDTTTTWKKACAFLSRHFLVFFLRRKCILALIKVIPNVRCKALHQRFKCFVFFAGFSVERRFQFETRGTNSQANAKVQEVRHEQVQHTRSRSQGRQAPSEEAEVGGGDVNALPWNFWRSHGGHGRSDGLRPPPRQRRLQREPRRPRRPRRNPPIALYEMWCLRAKRVFSGMYLNL